MLEAGTDQASLNLERAVANPTRKLDNFGEQRGRVQLELLAELTQSARAISGNGYT